MSELRRLLDEDCDDLARAMLRAATDEEPPRGSLTALAAALGVAPGLTSVALLGSGSSTAVSGASGSVGTAGAGASLATAGLAAGAGAGAATSLTAMVVAKYVAFGMVSGLFAMGGLTLANEAKDASSHGASPPAVARALTVAAPPPDAVRAMPTGTPSLGNEELPQDAEHRDVHSAKVPARAARAARRASESERAASAPVVEENAAAAAAAFVDETPKPVESAQVVEQNKGLAKELALLDRARSSLLGGRASEALLLLEQYRSVRVSMILDPEAEALRILALDRLGQHTTASRLAREFIAGHPASRQVDSLRQLAERP